MGRYLHSIAVQQQAPAADGIFTHDLPVNPLSVVLVHLRPLNELTAMTTFGSYYALMDAINALTISYQGQAVIAGSGRDLAAMAHFRHRIDWLQANMSAVNNERRSAVLPIIMGRKAFDPKSAFPRSTRGELVLTLDLDIADTTYDGLQYTVETIELLDAAPEEYERRVTIARTFAATGINEVDLPIGNLMRGLLLFGTTAFTGAAPAPSWGRVALLKDQSEVFISSSDFEVLAGAVGLRRVYPSPNNAHTHSFADAAAGETFTRIADEVTAGQEQYAYIPLDPWDDDAFGLDTAGAARVHLRADAETADAVRVMPVERIRVAA